MELLVENLRVSVGQKEIVKGISINVKGGEIHAIMGPNGSGKSSFAYALAGHPLYKAEGKAILNGIDLLSMKPEERAKHLFLSFQQPPFIEGLTLKDMLKEAYFSFHNLERSVKSYASFEKELKEALSLLGLPSSFLAREVNKNFSGGEKKRSEALAMLLLKPSLIIVDEIDSGLDVDALKVIAKAMATLKSPERGFIVITHYSRILNHFPPTHVHIMKDGKIVRRGGKALVEEVEAKGYN